MYVRAVVARLFIVAYVARSLAMQTCTYVVITSSHLRRSRTRIFAIDKSYATASRSVLARRSVSIAVGRSFSAAGADRSYPPRFAAIRRGSLRALRFRIQESRRWKCNAR